MLEISRVVELAIYVEDLDTACHFYSEILGLELIHDQKPRHVFFRVGDSMLLVFNPEETRTGGQIPPHGSEGAGHFALGIPTDSYETWKSYLQEQSIEIEQEVEWPLGGHSMYFRDPSGNSVELITKGCWGTPGGW